MADFVLDIERFFHSKDWKELWTQAQVRVQSCQSHCKTAECSHSCAQPLVDLNQFIERKKEVYVKKGVEYCKRECWESKQVSECADRCVKEYSTLFEDFRTALLERLAATKFHESA